jgi:predicted Zn finger-like uncharacterized protein
MYIVCPHCTTSYAINPNSLGAAGRSVRCSRCKETWHAWPEDAAEAGAPAMAAAEPMEAQSTAGEQWNSYAEDVAGSPEVESPSIAAGWPGERARPEYVEDWAAAEDDEDTRGAHHSWLVRLFRRSTPPAAIAPRPARTSLFGLPTACAGMGALVMALLVWRADVVRLLPQTAAFYRIAGLEVNLRGLAFKDIKLSNETVDGKPVLVIEGVIVGQSKKPVEIPRLRFAVRDAQGAEIYAWNTVLDQTVLKPGERAFFKSRLASPPAEGRNIDIRFFNRRDLAAGSA